LEKVNERKRTWDYFEINHPKAISDKKLEQLKAKYTRRKTENDILLSKSNIKDKNANEKLVTSRSCSSRAPHSTPPVVRTQTLAVFEGLEGSPLPKKSLDLAFDPLTGECLETESVDSGRESEMTRKLSSDSSDEGSSSRKSSKSGGRRRSSHLGDILESENIPEEAVLECFIDPFTGQFITNLAKKSENDKIETSNGANKIRNNNNNNSKNLRVNVDCKAASQVDDGFGSLPITPTDPAKNNKSLSVLKKGEADADSIIATDDGIYTISAVLRRCMPRGLSLFTFGEPPGHLGTTAPVVTAVAMGLLSLSARRRRAPWGKRSSVISRQTADQANNPAGAKPRRSRVAGAVGRAVRAAQTTLPNATHRLREAIRRRAGAATPQISDEKVRDDKADDYEELYVRALRLVKIFVVVTFVPFLFCLKNFFSYNKKLSDFNLEYGPHLATSTLKATSGIQMVMISLMLA